MQSRLSSISSFSSESVGRLYLPAQRRAKEVISDEDRSLAEERYRVQVKDVMVETPDGASLDTIEIQPPDLAEERESYCVIKFNGNGGFYQDSFMQMAADSVRLSATIIGFNYRHVNLSSDDAPSRFNDLVVDGMTEVSRLLERGIPATHLTLDGISLGGAIATCTAANQHRAQNTVYLFNDRSLSSLTAAALGLVARDSSRLTKALLGSSIASVNYLTGWSQNIADEYNYIPADFKSHMFVEYIANVSADEVIVPPASLHAGVVPYEQQHGINTARAVIAPGLFGHNARRVDLVDLANSKITGQDIADELALRHRQGL